MTSTRTLKEWIKLITWTTTLQSITLPSATNDQRAVLDDDLTNKDLFEVLKGKLNNKSPSNDGLREEFYETFWDELKYTFIIEQSWPITKQH